MTSTAHSCMHEITRVFVSGKAIVAACANNYRRAAALCVHTDHAEHSKMVNFGQLTQGLHAWREGRVQPGRKKKRFLSFFSSAIKKHHKEREHAKERSTHCHFSHEGW